MTEPRLEELRQRLASARLAAFAASSSSRRAWLATMNAAISAGSSEVGGGSPIIGHF